MTRDISMDFGVAVTGAAYKLLASNGTLGSAVTTGFANVSATTVYFGADVDMGAARGIYWYCDTAGVTGFALFEIVTQTHTNTATLEANTVRIT